MSDSLHIVCPHCEAVNRVPSERLRAAPTCGRCHRPLFTGHPLETGEVTFEKHLTRNDIPVLVDFWAPWCGPCRMMAPQFEQAARQLKGRALLVKVNSDEAPRTSARFAIRSIPTLVRLDGGVERSRQSGAVPAAQIVALAG